MGTRRLPSQCARWKRHASTPPTARTATGPVGTAGDWQCLVLPVVALRCGLGHVLDLADRFFDELREEMRSELDALDQKLPACAWLPLTG